MHYVKILYHPSTHGVASYHDIFLGRLFLRATFYLRCFLIHKCLVNATINKAPAKCYETGIVYRKGMERESEKKKQEKLIF